MPADDGLDPPDEIALQLVHARQPLAPHPFLALGTAFPVRLVGLVPTDVDELRREQREGLGEDVLDHGERPVVARAIDVGGAAGGGLAPQLRHGLQDRRRVAGHLDLRHHRDAARGGERDEFPDVVLRIAQRVRQLRVLPDIEPPALIVDEVPVEAVQLVPRQRVEERADFLLGEEVRGAVQQHPPPGESGLVPDVQAGQLRGVRVQRQQLRKALQAVEEPRGVRCRDLDTARADGHFIGLRVGPARLLQDDLTHVRMRDAKGELRKGLRGAYEQLSHRGEVAPARGHGDRRLAFQLEDARRRANGCGDGDDGVHGSKKGPYHHDVTVRPKPQG